MNTSSQIDTSASSVKISVPSRRGFLRRLAKDSRGANFVEYLVLIGVVALLGASIFSGFKSNVTTAATKAGTSLGKIIP